MHFAFQTFYWSIPDRFLWVWERALCEITAALCPIELLKLILLPWDRFQVNLCLLHLRLAFLILFLTKIIHTLMVNICSWSWQMRASLCFSRSSCSYFWSHRRFKVFIIVTESVDRYERSGIGYRLSSAFFPILRRWVYRDLNKWSITEDTYALDINEISEQILKWLFVFLFNALDHSREFLNLRRTQSWNCGVHLYIISADIIAVCELLKNAFNKIESK